MKNLKGERRLSFKELRVREAMEKQAVRDSFKISDEEWDKINNEKITNRNKYKMAGTGSKKSFAAKVIVHKKNGVTIEIK
jgi:hypothetical protein